MNRNGLRKPSPMKANRKATKAMSRNGVRFLGGAFGVAALLPQHARAHFAVEIVAIEQAPKRDRHQDVRQPTGKIVDHIRSEEHTSELQSLTRITSPDFCLNK